LLRGHGGANGSNPPWECQQKQYLHSLSDRHLSEKADGTVQISFFGDYELQAVARRLDLALQILLQSAHMVHRVLEVPATEIDELAARLNR